MKVVHFITLGCAKNEVDTRDMQDRLASSGFSIGDDPEGCDAIVVNTCAFIQPAIEESIDAIFEAAGLANVEDGSTPVIVAGCLPSRFGEDLEAELTEVKRFVPCSDEDDIVDVVISCIGQPDDAGAVALASEEAAQAFAYVKISDGCSRWCSYCTIPIIRGPYHSFPQEQIISEAEALVSQGAKELVLIGQDTGLWGSDFAEPLELSDLLEALSDRFPDTWIRVMYTQPEHVSERLMRTIAVHPNICPYLDIPMQHSSPRILSRMNRKGSGDEFLTLIGRAREIIPNIALRSTFIAGFPGETEDEFEELADFLEEARFDYVGVFPYSREEGTRSFDMEGQLDEDEKAYRAEHLRTIADVISSQVISARIGTLLPFICEGEEIDGQLFGRCITQAPEVDGLTFVDSGSPGKFSDVMIEDTLLYDMEGSEA